MISIYADTAGIVNGIKAFTVGAVIIRSPCGGIIGFLQPLDSIAGSWL